MRHVHLAACLAPLLASLLLLPACGGIRASTRRPLTALRATDEAGRHSLAVGAAGHTSAQGVPSLRERFASRPDLRVAVLQMAYMVQGASRVHAVRDLRSFGGVTTWTVQTIRELEVPPELGFTLALDATTRLEEALQRHGFEVVPHQQITATSAYQAAYGPLPSARVVSGGLADGWTAFPAPSMRIRDFSNIVQFNTAHELFVDTPVIAQIQEELGQDVLFLCVMERLQTWEGSHARRQGMVGHTSTAWLIDPQYVGYGVGNYGHTIVALDLVVEPSAQAAFIQHVGNGMLTVDWNPVFADARIANEYAAEAFAEDLAALRAPEE